MRAVITIWLLFIVISVSDLVKISDFVHVNKNKQKLDVRCGVIYDALKAQS
jgi:hypothetical protein